MLFVKEADGDYLEMGISDTQEACLPSQLTARFKLSPIAFAADNMKDGIRMV